VLESVLLNKIIGENDFEEDEEWRK